MTFSCLIKQFIEGALNWLTGVAIIGIPKVHIAMSHFLPF